MNKHLFYLLIFCLLSCQNQGEKRQNIEAEQNLLINKTSTSSELECKCFDGIGSVKGDQAVLTTQFSNGTSLSLCGYVDEDVNEEELIVSEFNLFDCATGKSLLEYSAVQTCAIEEKQDTLIIKELKHMAADSNWQWKWVQISQQLIYPKDETIYVATAQAKLDSKNIHISAAEQKRFLKQVAKGNLTDAENTISQLEVLSLLGNDQAWEALKNYRQLSAELIDGALAEHLNSALTTSEWLRGREN